MGKNTLLWTFLEVIVVVLFLSESNIVALKLGKNG
jgi:hypothetical protein